jgi:hypothetical protein
VQPGERAIVRIGAQLAGYHDPIATPVETLTVHPLGWLLASLTRDEVDLVLGAIAHATGSHREVEHLGESDGAGGWRITPGSPRLQHASLHDWPPPAMPGLDDWS